MAQLPNNIVALLGVDVSNNVVNIDPNIFLEAKPSEQLIQQVLAPQQEQERPAPVVITNETSVALEIDADDNYIPIVSPDRLNLANSMLYQSNKRVGFNTKSPQHEIDVYLGSVNITTKTTTKGYKINGYNVASIDEATNKLFIGNDTEINVISLYSLLIKGLIPGSPLGESRIVTINDLGVVSATQDVFLRSINGLTAKNQTFATGTSGTDFNIVSSTSTHTFNIPTASAVNRGLLSSADWTTFNNKFALPTFTAGAVIFSDGTTLVQDYNNFSYDDANNRLTITSLYAPTIGNPTGVTANNTWTFSSNVNVPLAPTLDAHAASKKYVDDTALTGLRLGAEVKTVSLTNITLSGNQTISGYATSTGDRVLVTGQTTKSENGIYVTATGAWTRATDSDTDAELRGYQYLVVAGAESGARFGNTNTTTITVGTTDITYQRISSAEVDPIFTASAAYGITSTNISNWNTAYDRSITSITVSGSGTSSKTITFNRQSGGALTATFTDAIHSISGTTNRITVSTASNVATVDIASNYAGQSSIATVGTITTGVWQGTAVADAYIASAATWNAKQNAITGAATTITTSNLTINRVLVSDASGKVAVSSVTSTELGYLSGVTSAIQTQINNRQPLNATLTALAGLSLFTGFLRYSTSTSSWSFDNSDYYPASNPNGYTTNTGTVTSVSVVSANGFGGSVANSTTTPAITITTSVNGLIKGNGSAISAAIGNTDYQVPITLTTTGSGAATFNGTTLNIPTPATGVTSFNGRTGAVVPAEGDYTLNQLSDVNIAGPTNGQVLTYSNGTWVNLTPTGGSAGLGGSGTTNKVSKFTGSTTLGDSNITDSGSAISFYGVPSAAYRVNIQTPGGRFVSFWSPTIDNIDANGIMSHNGNGLFDQTPLGLYGSVIVFGTGITEAARMTGGNWLVGTATNITGGGKLQVSGNVNITGQFMVNGVPISGGGGVAGVSSFNGRTGVVVSQVGDYNITQLSGVAISSPSVGQVLTFNGTNWVNAAPTGGGGGGGVTFLSQLQDVSISSLQNGQALIYDSALGRWRNQTISAGGGSGNVSTGGGTTNQIVKFTGSTSIGNSIMAEVDGNRINVSGTVYATAFYEFSDVRKKNIVEKLQSFDASRIDAIQYYFKDDKDQNLRIGYSAQQIQELAPDLVHKNEEGFLTISYANVHTIKIAQLEDRVKVLEKEIIDLRNRQSTTQL